MIESSYVGLVEFAEKYCCAPGVKLYPHQKQLLQFLEDGGSFIQSPRHMGKNWARKVIEDYANGKL